MLCSVLWSIGYPQSCVGPRTSAGGPGSLDTMPTAFYLSHIHVYMSFRTVEDLLSMFCGGPGARR